MSNNKAFKVKNGLELAAIAASKAVTAVDVFVYDTSKDSDGGAWRKRTQHTSWYNETLNTATRGSRREFPAVAVIVAVASDGIKIYDGDDPSLPLWMEFEPGSVASWGVMNLMSHGTFSSVAMLNGRLSVGMTSSDGCVNVADFINDTGYKHHSSTSYGGPYKGNIAERNSGKGYAGPQAGVNPANIVNGAVNDVAMTVLPDAPIDPATGLPVPTIAVATAGGVSVIKDDGKIWDITGTNWGGSSNGVIFDGGTLYFIQAAYYWISCDVAGLAQDHVLSDGYNVTNDNYPFKRVNLNEAIAYEGGQRRVAAGGSCFDLAHCASYVYPGTRLVKHKRGVTGGPNLLNYTTSTYNTGWMNGDIKGAFLADTDDTDLVGSGELVTNGTFDTDTSGWTATANGAISWDSGSGGRALVTHVFGGGQSATTTIPTAVGATYTVSVYTDANGNGATPLLYVNNALKVQPSFNYVGFMTTTFVAVSTSTSIGVGWNDQVSGYYDNISVKLADHDRSVNANGLIVNGTVTRTPVATGAELVAYSGDNLNYLSRDWAGAYSGQSTFAFIFWGYGGFGGQFWRWYEDPVGSTYLQSYVDGTTGVPRYIWQGRQGLNTGSNGVSCVNRWSLHCITFSGGIFQQYQDGQFVTQTTTGITAALHDLRISPTAGCKMSLLRLSETIPTAEQIKKIYEDEKVLFQENAAATLYGTSDAVTALAHDEDTGLLHVGTSAGRSVFQGLRRVSNTTTAVGTAISASNGLVVEE